jgi:hypothetical protein
MYYNYTSVIIVTENKLDYPDRGLEKYQKSQSGEMKAKWFNVI